jgi:O-antigen/teichoic acid export membrane protein
MAHGRAMVGTLAPSVVRLGGAGLQFLSTVLVARALGDGPGALFFFWAAVLTTGAPIATFGLEQIALRQVPRTHRDAPESVARLVGVLRAISLVVSALLGGALVVYAAWPDAARSGIQLWHFLPPFALAGIALSLINGESLKGLSRPVLGTVYGHFLPVALFCVLVALFARRLEAPGILALYTGSYVVAALAARFAPDPVFRGRLVHRPSRVELNGLLREGGLVCCASLFGALGFILPLAILERSQPAAEVSHVTTAFRIAILFLVLASAVHGVFAPALSRAAEAARPLGPVFRTYGKAIMIATATLALPLGFGILFPELVMSVFGEGFRDGADVLRLLLIVQLASLLLGPVPHLVLMTGHTSFLARISAVKFVLAVALALLLVPRYGGIGMVAAMGIAFVGEEILGLAYVVAKLKARDRHPESAASDP